MTNCCRARPVGPARIGRRAEADDDDHRQNPASAQGNVLRFSRVLRSASSGANVISLANFLAPAAGADEVGDGDAVDQHGDQGRRAAQQHVQRHPLSWRRGIPRPPSAALARPVQVPAISCRLAPVRCRSSSISRFCASRLFLAAALKSPPARPTTKLAASRSTAKQRRERKKCGPSKRHPVLTPPHRQTGHRRTDRR